MLPFLTSAQTTVTGSVKNKQGEPLVVNVLIQAKGSFAISGFTTTNAEGNYSMTYRGIADSIILTVSGMNVGKHSKTVANRSGRVDFEIEEKPLEINEVSITATKIKQVGDTVNYSVATFKDQSDRVISDVLKKLPGISVSPIGGISYMGSPINKFYIEGMDMLQGRYGIAVNNISAEDVATVQVLENHQPVRALRNKVFSNNAAINIKLKESAKGTFSVSGVAGIGYKPLMWNAELVSMYFARNMQNMNAYKINNSGIDISAEFRRHYDYERVYLGSESPLYVQSPGTPPIPQKRFLYNNSHTLTVNQLVKINENSEITANALYYHDRIKKTGFSRYEQYLPGDSVFVIEEQIGALSKIHNLEFALRFNNNAENYYLTNAFNIRSGWNSDTGTGLTQSNAGNLDKTLTQWLDKPFFGIDNTVNLIKNTKNNTYQMYFSTGYAQRAHTLTVSPADYFSGLQASSLTQDVFLRDFASVLRVSYGLKLGNFDLNYALWGRADIQNMETVLLRDKETAAHDSLRNDLWYDNYRTGFNQSYTYKTNKLNLALNLPLTFEIITADDRIPEILLRDSRLLFNPSVSVRYQLTHEWSISSGSNFNRSFGDMNSNYTGYIMHGYRSLERNTVVRPFETRSAGANASVSYRNVLISLFLTAGINYKYSWHSLLYGFDYLGIIDIKNTLDQPTTSDGYGINLDGSRGLDFWRATWRLFCNYGFGRNKQLIQGKVFNYRSQSYSVGTGINTSPVQFLRVNYSFSWSKRKSYAIEQTRRFPPITGISQDIKINLFPVKTITGNFGVEHQYNSAASKHHTVFADAGINFKRNRLDMGIEINNIFNSKQYVSASFNDFSAYYTSFELRPLSVLVSVKFKIP